MCLTFDVCCRFTTVIAVTVQGCLQLPYRINGSVSFPRLKLLPQQIDIKRLRMDAFQTYQITATNVGTTLLRMQVLLEEYPEFHVSLSNDKNSIIGKRRYKNNQVKDISGKELGRTANGRNLEMFKIMK